MDFVVCCDQFLGIGAVDSVLWCLPHRKNEDVVILVQSQIWLVDDGLGHLESV